MIYLLVTVHVLVCFFLIIVVLLQSGKAADLAGAFGGMGSQTAFGPRGAATVLSKATTVAAVLFMLSSLVLSIHATRGGGGAPGTSVLDRDKTTKQAPAQAPKAPGTPAKVPEVPTGSGQPVDIHIVPPGAQAPKDGVAVPVQPVQAPPAEKPAPAGKK